MISILNLTTNSNDIKSLIKHTLSPAVQSPLFSRCPATSHICLRLAVSASKWGRRLWKFHFLPHPRAGPTVFISLHQQLRICSTLSTLTTVAKDKRPRGLSPPGEACFSTSTHYSNQDHQSTAIQKRDGPSKPGFTPYPDSSTEKPNPHQNKPVSPQAVRSRSSG